MKNLSPLKFVSVLETLVSQCEGIGTFVDNITKSVREVGSCSARATKAIAGHTSTFVAGAAGGALGVLIKALVGDLPKQFVGWLKKGKDAILNLIRKLLRKMLKAVKDVFGKKGNKGPTDLEGQAATCPMISLKDKNSPKKTGGKPRKTSTCFVGTTRFLTKIGFREARHFSPGLRVETWQDDETILRGPAAPPYPHSASELRQISLFLQRRDGSACWVNLLRSLDWIEDYGAHVGGTVFLDMPEMGVEGLAEVLAIEPCPPLEEGEGRLVTGTFKHTSGEVYDLKLASESKPIGVTATHPFWSVDRHTWVSAGWHRLRPDGIGELGGRGFCRAGVSVPSKRLGGSLALPSTRFSLFSTV